MAAILAPALRQRLALFRAPLRLAHARRVRHAAAADPEDRRSRMLARREAALDEVESIRAMAVSAIGHALASGVPALTEVARAHREQSAVLAVAAAATIMRLTRSSLLEVLRNDYIRTAWSKGLRERTVVMRHALKNAMIPVVTIVGLQVGGLIGGSVIVESLFNLNGVGKYILEAILKRDLFVVQSIT